MRTRLVTWILGLLLLCGPAFGQVLTPYMKALLDQYYFSRFDTNIALWNEAYSWGNWAAALNGMSNTIFGNVSNLQDVLGILTSNSPTIYHSETGATWKLAYPVTVHGWFYLRGLDGGRATNIPWGITFKDVPEVTLGVIGYCPVASGVPTNVNQFGTWHSSGFVDGVNRTNTTTTGMSAVGFWTADLSAYYVGFSFIATGETP